jgi:hypothetical protein
MMETEMMGLGTDTRKQWLCLINCDKIYAWTWVPMQRNQQCNSRKNIFFFSWWSLTYNVPKFLDSHMSFCDVQNTNLVRSIVASNINRILALKRPVFGTSHTQNCNTLFITTPSRPSYIKMQLLITFFTPTSS